MTPWIEVEAMKGTSTVEQLWRDEHGVAAWCACERILVVVLICFDRIDASNATEAAWRHSGQLDDQMEAAAEIEEAVELQELE